MELKTDTELFEIMYRELGLICGEEYIFTDFHSLELYGRDQCAEFKCSFQILIKPASSDEISKVLKLCNTYDVPVSPRGGGSGVVGASLPINGGVVLSLERLNRILEIDKINLVVTAEAGVVSAELLERLEEQDLFFPIVPSSYHSSFIGGNVATNAGSPRSCKYGKIEDYVLNLEVILPNGDIIWSGANVTKKSIGFDLNHLFIGSEGLLGIISKVVLKVLPKPTYEICYLAGFSDLKSACDVIKQIKIDGLDVSAVELICRSAIDITSDYLVRDVPLAENHINAHLLIEYLGEKTFHEVSFINQLNEIFNKYGAVEVLIGESFAEKKRLWQLRLSIGEAMTSNGFSYRDIDVCIPASLLFDFLNTVEGICVENDIKSICFGHAYDGNMHTMILGENERDNDEDIRKKRNKVVEMIFKYAIKHGGVISGEHGIGLLQKQYLSMQFPVERLNCMKKIKEAFDPNDILNRGHMFN